MEHPPAGRTPQIGARHNRLNRNKKKYRQIQINRVTLTTPHENYELNEVENDE